MRKEIVVEMFYRIIQAGYTSIHACYFVTKIRVHSMDLYSNFKTLQISINWACFVK